MEKLYTNLRVMFQDEAGFGRINKPKRCWCPIGIRPTVPCQRIREYTYAYAAASPKDGEMVSLILPYANTDCMNIFLDEVSKRYSNDYILMIADGAAWHKSKSLNLPSNIEIFPLLPYSPELNPVENLWDETREKGFKNEVFNSIKDVESRLCETLFELENDKCRVKSITGWEWIFSM
ncbi:MAG: IS630 family transposase [Endomicrobia bacterium]|nr:IS630 family transposase [Endomicrobiia bacterium]